MTFFTDTDVANAVSARDIHMSELFEVDFSSGVERYSTELVGFTDADGNYWEPKRGEGGDVLTSTPYTQPKDGVAATSVTYTISASDQAVGDLFMDTPEREYRGRYIKHLMQLFDNDGAAIGRPVAFPPAFMDHASISWTPGGNVKIAMVCEGFFSSRNSPQYGYITDQNQKALYPTDRGLERQHLATQDTFYQWPV